MPKGAKLDTAVANPNVLIQTVGSVERDQCRAENGSACVSCSDPVEDACIALSTVLMISALLAASLLARACFVPNYSPGGVFQQWAV
jgi:hypothetical protein